MKRLTEKHGELYIYNYDKDCDIETREERMIDTHCAIVNKLGQKEDDDEELGIDSHILFKVLKSESIYANGKRYDNSNSLSYMGNSWVIYNHQAKRCFSLKDYGKNWGLRKEDLENDK